ncbi:hypothetical protein [Glacieibacterium sp.]|uniref:hypothetical protein n=1 Tax=Glacieibacterium sp. TaxID=2860237 RepID=UPI003AFF7D34
MVLVAAVGIKPHRPVVPAGGQGETLAVLGVAPGAAPEAERHDVNRQVPPPSTATGTQATERQVPTT